MIIRLQQTVSWSIMCSLYSNRSFSPLTPNTLQENRKSTLFLPLKTLSQPNQLSYSENCPGQACIEFTNDVIKVLGQQANNEKVRCLLSSSQLKIDGIGLTREIFVIEGGQHL